MKDEHNHRYKLQPLSHIYKNHSFVLSKSITIGFVDGDDIDDDGICGTAVW